MVQSIKSKFILTKSDMITQYCSRATRSRSGAFGKLVKRLGSRKSDKSKEQSRNKNNSSIGNLDDYVRSVRRSQSMEQIQANSLKINRNAATPSASPVATPKFGKGFFRVRRNSEPDLQDNSSKSILVLSTSFVIIIHLISLYLNNVLYMIFLFLVGILFRTGSKKNLSVDPTEGNIQFDNLISNSKSFVSISFI